MLFNSIQFMLFFPVVVFLFFVIPKRMQCTWLLICSYYFYMCWSPKYALLLATSTLITYLSGRLISWSNAKGNTQREHREKQLWVFLSFAINLSILFLFKYFDFALDNINRVLSWFGMQILQPQFDVLLPVGISFYTFQALSYTVDVYRGKMDAEKSLLKYALFVSFFPQLVAGPIERSQTLLVQFHRPHAFEYSNVKNGLLLMMWGFFQKLVIADRAAVLVDAVYNNPAAYSGFSIVVATLLFAVQIYCDFSGYSDIAIGAAQVMGFSLMQNFKQPYHATSIHDFWRRWHISLSTWFRDYLYIPMGGSRCATIKKYRNLMATFLVSGLWHGASWNYVVWGGLHGLYQIVGDILRPFKEKTLNRLGISQESKILKMAKRLATFLLVDFAWVFFRAPSVHTGLFMAKQIVCNTKWKDAMLLSSYLLAGDQMNAFILAVAIIVLFVVDSRKNAGKLHFCAFLERQKRPIRWMLYYLFVFILLICGVVLMDKTQSQFIYFQF